MGQLGLGVMINRLMGNEDSVNAFKAGLNKKITACYLKDNVLHFEFEDGYKMGIYDNGQLCCEHRYITTDDDPPHYVGGKLIDIEIKDAPSVPDKYGEAHDVQFLVVKTTKGHFTLETHNEHNGYYGGFSITAKKE